jgi:hypothetical protein
MSEPVPIWLMRQATGRCIAPNRFNDSRLAQPNPQVGKPKQEIITTILIVDASWPGVSSTSECASTLL